MKYKVCYCIILVISASFFGCDNDDFSQNNNEVDDNPIVDSQEPIDYSEIPQSDIYDVSIIKENKKENQTVFKSTCPEFQLGKQNMIENDQYPLGIFSGRSISWTNFSFKGSITVEVKVTNQSTVGLGGTVKILPSRFGIIPEVSGNIIRFVLNNPGQFSVEIGANGYKNGLMVFADPEETNIPNPTAEGYKVLKPNALSTTNSIVSSSSGIYFEKGIHNIGVYHVPVNIKNIYLEQGSWVYGALIMDGNPNVKIFGRGVLSAAKLNYRESHSIEAINQSDNIQLEGITIADQKHFAVRLIGQNNTVKFIKTIGGWAYNSDGITAFAGSTVNNCFIWANDDAIKVYRSNISWEDCVVWQLNNGGVIQMGWMGPNSSNVTISRIDVLHAEWNKPGFNRALLNYVGNSYNEPGKSGFHSNWLIEDVVTETPIPIIFNIAPDDFSKNPIHGLTLKNWNVKMTMNTTFQNMIIGNDPSEPFDGFVFDNVNINDVKLDGSNWLEVTNMQKENLITPEFK